MSEPKEPKHYGHDVGFSDPGDYPPSNGFCETCLTDLSQEELDALLAYSGGWVVIAKEIRDLRAALAARDALVGEMATLLRECVDNIRPHDHHALAAYTEGHRFLNRPDVVAALAAKPTKETP